jgi:DNA-binding CsgD family transcriptional regulator/tetratricopeptide (TPR) repeat protein
VEGSGVGLVGRAGPLAALVEAISTDRPAVVVGEAGIGKTTLVRAAASAASHALHEGGGFATLARVPYLALRRATDGSLRGDPSAVAAVVERIVGPDVLFVDDLQWVDAASVDALRRLAGRTLLVAAIRIGDAATADALATAATLGLQRITLDGLDPGAARLVVRGVRPDLADAAVERIVERAAGNPLVLEELARTGDPARLLARGLAAREERLSPAARDAVRLLAVADGPIPRDRLGSVVDEAIAEGLAVPTAGGIGIRHALLAETIRDGLPDRDRRRLHRQVASLVDGPALVSRHLAAAGRFAEAAASATEALTATRDPFERAALLAIVAGAARGRGTLAARLVAARALDELSDWPAVERLLGPTRRSGEPGELVERDVLLARAAHATGRLDHADRLLRQAAARPVDPASPAAALLTIERCRYRVNVTGAVAEALGAIDAALRAQPPDAWPAHALRVLAASITTLAIGPGDLELLRSTADQALAAGAFRSAADQARVVQYALLMHVGAAAAVDWALDRRRAFAESGVSGVALEFQAESVEALILDGRLAAAIAQADEVLEQPAPFRARQGAAIFRARALVLMGRFEAAEGALAADGAAVSGDYFGAGEALGVRAEHAFWSGSPARALAFAEQSLAVPSPVPGAETMARLTADWASWAMGRPLDDDPPDGRTRSLAGSGPERRALRALAAGDHRAAADGFAEAADRWAGFSAPREVICRWAAGDASRLAGDDATASLARALELADAMGAEAVGSRIRRSLRQAGVRVTGTRGAREASRLRLTERERELIGLVERGLSNVEIARRLGLGRPTVARILASAMDKVGAEGRNALAGLGTPT